MKNKLILLILLSTALMSCGNWYQEPNPVVYYCSPIGVYRYYQPRYYNIQRVHNPYKSRRR